MTLRTKLGGWIAGVDIEAMEMELRGCMIGSLNYMLDGEQYEDGLTEIEEATRDVQNGTGRKINRMAKEALGLDDKPMKLGA